MIVSQLRTDLQGTMLIHTKTLRLKYRYKIKLIDNIITIVERNLKKNAFKRTRREIPLIRRVQMIILWLS